ncbi:3028_t:CDS:2 [Diversispora eburnea]|uniref:3028_t:CDS:1 n=1 Tax=Diversispora eburnea TaxID=1213867 RepID=A0A9N8UYV4_9GLOM|nr:3028_t:CDS:2 [Diversispora eburnea]
MSITMKFLFFFVAYFVLTAYASEIVIKVGNLKYDPKTVDAKKGDVLVFTWLSDGSQHDVIQSDSEGSCDASTTRTSIKSDIKSSGTYNYTITEDANTKLYYYCSVGNHCDSGMYGTINVVSNDTTITSSSGSSPTGGSGSSSTQTATKSSAVSFNSITAVTLLVFVSIVSDDDTPSIATATDISSSGSSPTGATSRGSGPSSTPTQTKTNSAVSFNSITVITLLVFVSSIPCYSKK